MKTVILFLFLVCLFICKSSSAQTLFEDAEGKTSINLPLGGIARLNTTDRSLKIGYYYNRSDKDLVFGIDASGESNNGFAPLISNKKLSPEAHFNFNIGFKNISTDDSNPSGYDYLNIKIGVGEARYRLVDVESAFDDQISSSLFTKFNVGISYNYFLNGNMIFGGYAGYDRKNNISSLNQLTIKETSPIGTDPSGSAVRTAESEYTAWEGPIETINQLSLYLDYIYMPGSLNNRIAISIYSRSGFNRFQNSTNGGFGVYINRKGNPLKIVGGLIYEFEDVFDAGNTGTSLGDRGTLGLVVGYNF